MNAERIVIETTEYRPGGFRADAFPADGGKRPRWMRQLVETDESATLAHLRLWERIRKTRSGSTLVFVPAESEAAR